MNKLRLFFGIPLKEEIKEKIFEYLNKNKLLKKNYKWVQKENYHITLKFLGDVSEGLIEKLEKVGEEVASTFNIFSLYTSEFGGFPDIKKARVFFLSVKEVEKIERVFELLDNKLAHLNFERERRKYHPHITLARLREFESLPDLKPLELKLDIEGFSLYESILKREGPSYKILKYFPFRR
ncbi:MAG: RNA 2',3'-cyclic phosphodiesterase [candidate division WOR-3 bacterium]